MGCFTFDLGVDTGLREFRERPGEWGYKLENRELEAGTLFYLIFKNMFY